MNRCYKSVSVNINYWEGGKKWSGLDTPVPSSVMRKSTDFNLYLNNLAWVGLHLINIWLQCPTFYKYIHMQTHKYTYNYIYIQRHLENTHMQKSLKERLNEHTESIQQRDRCLQVSLFIKQISFYPQLQI